MLGFDYREIDEWQTRRQRRNLKAELPLLRVPAGLRGIGRAAAVALARLGADVAVSGTGRDPATFPDDEKAVGWKDVDSVVEQIRAEGRRGLALRFDVADREQTEAAVERIVSELGTNRHPHQQRRYRAGRGSNARAGSRPGPFPEGGGCQGPRHLPLHAGGHTAHLFSGRGREIVNIASVAGKRGSPNTLAYNAANFAMIGMTQSMAREFGPHGVNVNCVCPGAVATSRMDDVSPDNRPRRERPGDPVSRWGSDDEVGDFVAYLCTEASSWIHGQSINQDGGAIMEH